MIKTKWSFQTCRKWYLVVLLSFLLFRMCVPLSLALPSSIDSLAFSLIAMGGAFLLLFDLLYHRHLFQTRGNTWLFCLLAVGLLSSLINAGYGFFDNLKTLVWTAIQMFLLYATGKERKRRDVEEEIFLLARVFLLIWFLLISISVAMFVFQIGYVDGGILKIRQGFYDNRLWGLFKDPNYAAILSIVSIVLSVFYFKKTTHKTVKGIFFINVLVQFVYLVLSGSRTGMVAAIAVMATGVFLSLRPWLQGKTVRRWLCEGIATAGAVASIVLLLGTMELTKAGVEHIPDLVGAMGGHFAPVTLDRSDVVDNEDISNMRFKIWGSGFDVFKTTPVVGTSPRNTLDYAKDHLPDTFIVEKNYILHNGYLEVLVSTGILGTLFALGFIGNRVKIIVCYYFGTGWKSRRYYRESTYCLLICLAVAVSAVFLSEVFFANTLGTCLFWIFLGYSDFFMRRGIQREERKSEKMPLTCRIADWLEEKMRGRPQQLQRGE